MGYKGYWYQGSQVHGFLLIPKGSSTVVSLGRSPYPSPVHLQPHHNTGGVVYKPTQPRLVFLLSKVLSERW